MKSTVARSLGIALMGLEGHVVDVQTQVGTGLVCFSIVGVSDASLRESKERVRAALQSCGIVLPDRHTTVNLSPASLHKYGSGFDLAIAMSVMAANSLVKPEAMSDTVFLAELGLDGALRAVPGVLPCMAAASRLGIHRAVVPTACQMEANLVPGMEVLACDHLAQVIAWAGGKAARPLVVGATTPVSEVKPPSAASRLDMWDVRGQAEARFAVEVAAAGGHHLFLLGEPGSGKTMLASRLTTILPPLDHHTSVQVTAVHSVAGVLDARHGLLTQPPLQAPHHSATMPAIIGGGSGIPRPGAVSLAHGGVLLLDEAAEFQPAVLDALRQPLEQGAVTVHRSGATTRYPSSFQLVLASNPCPCGMDGARHRVCTCSSIQKRRYIARLSGPLLDRIDITVRMRQPTRADLAHDSREDSETIRGRVLQARERSTRRLKDTPWRVNAHVPGAWLRERSGIEPQILRHLDTAVEAGTLSLRGADRVLRLCWTLADLQGHATPSLSDVGKALQLRGGSVHE